MNTPTNTIYIPYHALDELNLIGLIADKPPATEVVPGTLYFATDALSLERSNGTSWEAYAGTGAVPGPVGPEGPQGDVGPKGDPGPVGPQGPKGDKGDIGTTGPQGPVGSTGPQGIQGPKGDTGAQGIQGIQGVAGPGVASGGTTGQVLSKTDNLDYHTQWIDAPTGGGVGADEVFVGPNDPGSAYELWFDTDEPIVPATGVPTGVIEMYAGSTAPTGYLMCDGSPVSRTSYTKLFGVIGITYGAGDGSSTFNVPDLRGRFALGKTASGTGSSLGSTGGTLDHTHTSAAHSHTSQYHAHSIQPHAHSIQPHAHSLPNHGHNVTVNGVGDHYHIAYGQTTNPAGGHTHVVSGPTGGAITDSSSTIGAGSAVPQVDAHHHDFGAYTDNQGSHQHSSPDANTNLSGGHNHTAAADVITLNTNANAAQNTDANVLQNTDATIVNTDSTTPGDTGANNPPFQTVNYIIHI